jgi:ABC-type sugar transport system substrate-binding protein
MNKIKVLFGVLMALTLLLAACAPAPAPANGEQEPDAQARVVTIGYGAPELSGGQGVIMNGMVTGGEQKGWAVVTTNANFDAAQQASQIDYFLALGVDAIVVVPVDSQAICASVQKASDAGVPFYTIDRAPIGCEINMTVQSDNYLAGKQAAEAMVALLTEKYGEPRGTVLELQGDMGQNVAQLRGGGFNDVMQNYPNITVISIPTEWRAEKFAQATLDVVSAQEVDGIYMHSDCVGTTVVLSALEQLGKKFARGEEGHIFLTGVDGCPDALRAIRDGYMSQASSQPLPDFGVVLSDYILMEMEGGEIQEGTVTREGALWSPASIVKADTGFMLNLATTSVNADNVDNPALWGNQAP